MQNLDITKEYYLDLSGYGLTSLPSSIGLLTHLEELDLHNNELQNLPPEIGLCTELAVLDLHNNKLRELPSTIGDLPQLGCLTLHHNQLQTVPPELSRCGLQELDLSYNQLQSLPSSMGCFSKKVLKLDLSYNQLQSLPSEIDLLVQRGYVEVKGNPISQVNDPLHMYTLNYGRAMSLLIDEKEGLSDDQIADKKKEALRLSKTVLQLEGDEQFKERINDLIEKICDLKPGRKLIKALSKLGHEISIRSGPRSECSLNGRQVTISNSVQEQAYRALDNGRVVIAKRTPEYILAHELIHALHLDNKPFRSETDDILPRMSNIEEQVTITGFSNRFFYRQIVNKYDVLSENAFLLAAGLLPRTSHCIEESDTLRASTIKKNEGGLSHYYEWLEQSYRQL